MSRLAALAAIAALAFSSARGPCDLKTIEKRTWCPKCVKYVEKADLKGEECVKDKAKVEKHEVCIKKVYVARCHPDRASDKPVSCCGVTYDKASEQLSKVIWACPACAQKGATLAGVKHADTCTSKTPKKTCELSGTGQHSVVK
jgi:hypothetical protein